MGFARDMDLRDIDSHSVPARIVRYVRAGCFQAGGYRWTTKWWANSFCSRYSMLSNYEWSLKRQLPLSFSACLSRQAGSNSLPRKRNLSLLSAGRNTLSGTLGQLRKEYFPNDKTKSLAAGFTSCRSYYCGCARKPALSSSKGGGCALKRMDCKTNKTRKAQDCSEPAQFITDRATNRRGALGSRPLRPYRPNEDWMAPAPAHDATVLRSASGRSTLLRAPVGILRSQR